MSNSLKSQGATLISYLLAHPDSTRVALERELNKKHGPWASYFHAVVQTVRNQVGEEVVTCRYDAKKHTYVYACADDAMSAMAYIVARKKKLKNEARNIVGMIDRTEVKYPGDPQIAYARVLLKSVVDLLSV